MSRYKFPLRVSNIDTKSKYSFSPTNPVKDVTCTPVLTVLSIAMRVLWKRSTGLEEGLYGGVVDMLDLELREQFSPQIINEVFTVI